MIDEIHKTVHYLIHKPDQEHQDINPSENPLELPFSLMLEHEFRKKNSQVKIQEVTIDFLKNPVHVPALLEKYGIKKDHFVCFDEVVCKRIDPTFPEALIEMKKNVAALWIAIGAKPVTGSFPITTFKKNGFVCPEMKYPLRNPIYVAKTAYKVSQDGVKNQLDGILQNKVDFDDTNIVQGQVIAIENVHSSYLSALQATIEKIPPPMFALIYIDDRQITNLVPEQIQTAFVKRTQPILIQIQGQRRLSVESKSLAERNMYADIFLKVVLKS